jgi:NADH-quinone oxidoreductase subunit M
LGALPDLNAREKWVVGPLIAILLVLGFYPAPALNLVRDPAKTTMTQVAVQDPAPAEKTAAAPTDNGSKS